MDNTEYTIKKDEIRSLIAQKEYIQAAEIADTIDWRRVRSVMMLCTISDLYKINRRYEDAKNMLLLAYEYRPGGRSICYSLCELCIKMEEFVEAVAYYKEFVQAAPKDPDRYVLQYKLYEAQDVSLEERIEVLKELKQKEYREKWAYELAYLYHRIGQATLCVEECDELILWFGDGKYVYKAMELKMLHQPLTSSQQETYNNRLDGIKVQENVAKASQAVVYPQPRGQSQGYEQQVHERPQGFERPQGYDRPQVHEQPQGYDRSQDYVALQGYEQPQGYVAPQGYDRSQDYVTPQGYDRPQVHEQPQGYDRSQDYVAPQGYEQPQGYVAPQGYEQPQGYVAPQGYDRSQGYVTPQGYDRPQVHEQPQGYVTPQGYGQSQDYEEFQEETLQQNSPEPEAAERISGVQSSYREPDFDDTQNMVSAEAEQGSSDKPIESEIQVPIMDMGRYNTMNLQAEIAAGLQEVLDKEDRTHVDEITRSIMAPMLESDTGQLDALDVEETEEDELNVGEVEETEVFFGETGEINSARFEAVKEIVPEMAHVRASETVPELEPEVKNVRISDVDGDTKVFEIVRSKKTVTPQVSMGSRTEADSRSEAGGRIGTDSRSEAGGRIGTDGRSEAGSRTEADSRPDIRREASIGAAASGVKRTGTLPDVRQVEDETAELVMHQMRLENKAEARVMIAQPPKELADVLSQESDGQISLVMPERETVEKQITGQMSIEDILAEWDRIKQENLERRRADLQRRVLQQTGNMFTEFEAAVRDGLLEKLESEIEQEMEEASRQGEPEKLEIISEPEDLGEIEELEEIQELDETAGFDDVKELPQTAPSEATKELSREFETEPKTEQKTESAAEPEKKSQAAIEPRQEPDSVLEPRQEPEAVSEPKQEPQGASEPMQEPEAAEEPGREFETESKTEQKTESAAEPEKKSQAAIEPRQEPEAALEPKQEPQGASEPVQEPEAAEEPGREFETESKTEQKTESAAEPEKKSQAAIEPRQESEAASESAQEPESVLEPVQEPEAASKSAQEPEAAEEPGREFETESKTEQKTESAAEPEKKSQTAIEPKQEPEAVSELEQEPEVVSKSEQEPEAASELEQEPETAMDPASELKQEPEEAEDYMAEEPVDTAEPEDDYQSEEQNSLPEEQERPPVRVLTREERELYAPYIQSRSAREQLVKAIDGISLAAYTGNVVITGEEGMNTITLAKNMIREIQMADRNFSGKVAKISGQGLGQRNVNETLDQLKNGALIIEKAAGMQAQTAAELARFLRQDNIGIIIVLEDTKKGIARLFAENPRLKVSFTAWMDVEALSNDTLASFGMKYARQKEFSIDDLGMLALHKRIEELQTIDHVVTVVEVKNIVDNAISHASKKTLGHFMDILLAKRYDEEDMIVLTEKDFV